jgi:glycosyltransferase involved in cell wall biosynthesis
LATADPDCRRAEHVPPFVGADFRPMEGAQQSSQGLEPGYVLCAGVQAAQVPFLLAAWSWVEGSTGEAAPLVLLGVEPAAEPGILEQARALGIESTVKVLPPLPLGELPGLFRGAAVYLSLDPEAHGQPLRWALSCGVPIAGLSGPSAAAVLGEAAYLVQPGTARRLGAACLTLLVDEQVAADLRRKGLARAEAYHGRGPREAWLRVFRATAS